jgi:hypothetical protein
MSLSADLLEFQTQTFKLLFRHSTSGDELCNKMDVKTVLDLIYASDDLIALEEPALYIESTYSKMTDLSPWASKLNLAVRLHCLTAKGIEVLSSSGTSFSTVIYDGKQIKSVEEAFFDLRSRIELDKTLLAGIKDDRTVYSISVKGTDLFSIKIGTLKASGIRDNITYQIRYYFEDVTESNVYCPKHSDNR